MNCARLICCRATSRSICATRGFCMNACTSIPLSRMFVLGPVLTTLQSFLNKKSPEPGLRPRRHSVCCPTLQSYLDWKAFLKSVCATGDLLRGECWPRPAEGASLPAYLQDRNSKYIPKSPPRLVGKWGCARTTPATRLWWPVAITS